MSATFRPEPRTKRGVAKRIDYSCGPLRYAELEAMARQSGVSLKELVRQMVEFALEHRKRGQ